MAGRSFTQHKVLLVSLLFFHVRVAVSSPTHRVFGEQCRGGSLVEPGDFSDHGCVARAGCPGGISSTILLDLAMALCSTSRDTVKCDANGVKSRKVRVRGRFQTVEASLKR